MTTMKFINAATLAQPPEFPIEEIADLQDRLARMKAEFDNYRGRVERERVRSSTTTRATS